MSSVFFVRMSADAPDEHAQKWLQDFRQFATRSPGESIASLVDKRSFGLVSHRATSRSWGISQSGPRGQRLILAGSAWRPDRPASLCMPDEALEWILGRPLERRPLLHGHYSLILVEPEFDRVTVENDPFGLLPIYYLQRTDGLLVASELKLLRSSSNRRIDQDAIAEIARFGYIVSDHTVLTDVKRLPPNHRLTYEGGRLKVTPHPFPAFSRDRAVDESVLEEMDHCLQMYFRRVRAETAYVSVSLSGGLDSRMVAASAKRAGLELTGFTTGSPQSLECEVAEVFARTLGIPIATHVFDGRKMPEWFSAATWVTEARVPSGHMHFLDAMMTGRYVAKPQLHGLIGDAVVGGDLEVSAKALGDNSLEVACRGLMTSFMYWPGDSYQAVWGPVMAGASANLEARVSESIIRQVGHTDTYSDTLWLRYVYRVFGFTVPCLGSQVQPWTDMYAPYLDPNLFTLAATLRSSDIHDRQAQIRWALRYYPETASLPRLKDGVLIPFSGKNSYESRIKWLRRKNKIRYLVGRLSRGRVNLAAPESYPYYDQWYRKWPTVRSYVNDTLTSRQAVERGLWDEQVVQRLLADLKLGRDVWNAVGALLQVEVFLQQVVDEVNIPSNPILPSTLGSL